MGGLLLLVLVGFVLSRFLGGKPSAPTDPIEDTPGTTRQVVSDQQVSLKYWGLWEPTEVVQKVIDQYEQENSGVTIEYVKQSPKDYRERLQTAIAGGSGPDLFRFHATWVPMLTEELSPLSATVTTPAELSSTYYPVVASQLVADGKVVGIPLMYEGLALLYNREILETANESPPTTWSELRTLANKLTVRSESGIDRAGIAMGNSVNVEHFSDILAVLMAQNGANFANPNSSQTRDALLYYTNFVKVDNVWSDKLPPSSVAFARGEVAMIFAPSWRIHEILAMNPNLKVGVAKLPVLSGEQLGWATYWAEGVSSQSKNKQAAEKFLKYLGSPEVLKQFYSQASTVRAFGEIYPQTSLAPELSDNLMIAPFLADAPKATGWYMSSFTHDNGINDQIIKYYEDGITAVLNGDQIEKVLNTLDQGVKQVLGQFDVI